MTNSIHCSTSVPEYLTLNDSNEQLDIHNKDTISPVSRLESLLGKCKRHTSFSDSKQTVSPDGYSMNNIQATPYNNNSVCDDFRVTVKGWDNVNNLLYSSNYSSSEIIFYKPELVMELRVYPQGWFI